MHDGEADETLVILDENAHAMPYSLLTCDDGGKIFSLYGEIFACSCPSMFPVKILLRDDALLSDARHDEKSDAKRRLVDGACAAMRNECAPAQRRRACVRF